MDYSFRPTVTGRGGAKTITEGVSITALTANTTTSFYFHIPHGRYYITKATFFCTTLASDADGTVLAKLEKFDFSANATVQVGASLDMEAATASTLTKFSLNTGDPSRIIAAGDWLRLDVVNNSAAIDTQPVNGWVSVELAVLA